MEGKGSPGEEPDSPASVTQEGQAASLAQMLLHKQSQVCVVGYVVEIVCENNANDLEVFELYTKSLGKIVRDNIQSKLNAVERRREKEGGVCCGFGM